MNSIKLLIIIMLLVSANSFGQYYNGRVPMRNSQTRPPTAQEIQKNKIEFIDKYVRELQTEVNLDELQAIAIKNEILTNDKAIDVVIKKEDSEEAKSKEIIALQEKTEKAILSYLNDKQKVKYEAFKQNQLKKKKDKKGKKDKKEEAPAEDELKQE